MAYEGQSAYRLTAPDRRAYDPTTLEQVYAQGLVQHTPHLGLLLGPSMLAATDRQNQQLDYAEQLAAVNDQQYRLGAGKIAADIADSDNKLVAAALKDPNQAYTFTRSRALIAPDMMEHGMRMADTGVSLDEARAVEAAGKGAQSFVEAGVAPPQGTTYTRLGLPNAPRVQGTPLDLQTASINASIQRATAGATQSGVKLTAATGMANAVDDIAQHRQQAISSGVRALFAQAGATYDTNGNMLTPPKLTTKQQQDIVDQETARADGVARRRYDTMQDIYGRAGYGRLTPSNPYSLQPNAPPTQTDPGGRGAPTVGTQGAPAVMTGGNTGNNRGNAPAPGSAAAARGGNAGSEVSAPETALRTTLARYGVQNPEQRIARIRAEAPPGATDFRAKPGAGIGQYVDRSGRVLKEVPLQ